MDSRFLAVIGMGLGYMSYQSDPIRIGLMHGILRQRKCSTNRSRAYVSIGFTF
ncbi:MAG: hypothetical protein MZV63_02070 [Marinilabiliales bacterium]|nr:hypothetical protein [Marinilabiliales bacterium]